MNVSQRSDFTFKYNRNLGRHGWLRLTPAYSVKLVSQIMDNIPKDSLILDPFSGTATTGLVASEKGLNSHSLDINPFLIWFGNAKCRNYSNTEISNIKRRLIGVISDFEKFKEKENWLPNIYKIGRWWSPVSLRALSGLRQAILNEFGDPKNSDTSALVWIAFCRLVIETSSAAFNHVSMSFRDETPEYEAKFIISLFSTIFDSIIESANVSIKGVSEIYSCDSRKPISLGTLKYTHVITSPPYPNRISYIRELRPYMYWTGFLDEAREAGELDWKAIGGTWGVATSRLIGWKATENGLPPDLDLVASKISKSGHKNAFLMSNYVRKYFHDMHLHFDKLRDCLAEGAELYYIVGNSSFYGIPVQTQSLLSDSLGILGYNRIEVEKIRKRNSKKELFEYCVRATWKRNGKKTKTININSPQCEFNIH